MPGPTLSKVQVLQTWLEKKIKGWGGVGWGGSKPGRGGGEKQEDGGVGTPTLIHEPAQRLSLG